MPIVFFDDEGGASSVMASSLAGAGVEVTSSSCDAAGQDPPFSVVVIGPKCARQHGLERCLRLRDAGYRGRIVVAGAPRDDGIALLDSGADDFLRPPVDVAELVARLRAALRSFDGHTYSRWGALELDYTRRVASMHARELALTPREFAILAMLIEAKGNVVSRSALLVRVWRENREPGSNLVEVNLSRLRDKLGDGAVIDTVRGVGYRLRR